jgi:hypothetical protein
VPNSSGPAAFLFYDDIKTNDLPAFGLEALG